MNHVMVTIKKQKHKLGKALLDLTLLYTLHERSTPFIFYSLFSSLILKATTGQNFDPWNAKGLFMK